MWIRESYGKGINILPIRGVTFDSICHITFHTVLQMCALFCGINSRLSHSSSLLKTHYFLDFHLSHPKLQVGCMAAEFRISFLNRSIFWRIYEDSVSGQTCRCHPTCLWCFTIREIAVADVGILRAGAAFASPQFFSSLFFSCQELSGLREEDGQWQIEKRRVIHSVRQSIRMTNGVTTLGYTIR